MKFKPQFIIIALGILSLGVCIWQMLQMKTMILSPWLLVALYLAIVLCISFLVGFIAKKILCSNWHTRTFASIIIIIICGIYYSSEYKPTYTIVIPENYVGEVKLFVSNEKENDFKINEYGIGYINKKTFDNGFYPKLMQGNNNITDEVNGYAKGLL